MHIFIRLYLIDAQDACTHSLTLHACAYVCTAPPRGGTAHARATRALQPSEPTRRRGAPVRCVGRRERGAWLRGCGSVSAESPCRAREALYSRLSRYRERNRNARRCSMQEPAGAGDSRTCGVCTAIRLYRLCNMCRIVHRTIFPHQSSLNTFQSEHIILTSTGWVLLKGAEASQTHDVHGRTI